MKLLFLFCKSFKMQLKYTHNTTLNTYFKKQQNTLNFFHHPSKTRILKKITNTWKILRQYLFIGLPGKHTAVGASHPHDSQVGRSIKHNDPFLLRFLLTFVLFLKGWTHTLPIATLGTLHLNGFQGRADIIPVENVVCSHDVWAYPYMPKSFARAYHLKWILLTWWCVSMHLMWKLHHVHWAREVHHVLQVLALNLSSVQQLLVFVNDLKEYKQQYSTILQQYAFWDTNTCK